MYAYYLHRLLDLLKMSSQVLHVEARIPIWVRSNTEANTQHVLLQGTIVATVYVLHFVIVFWAALTYYLGILIIIVLVTTLYMMLCPSLEKTRWADEVGSRLK